MPDDYHRQYRPFSPLSLDRRWPSRAITAAPRWLSTDLRDGNQAIPEPMDVGTKLAYFEMLTRIGFKEIEVAFPSASAIEFGFVRKLIEEDRIPDDVTIQVLTPARPELIVRTLESLRGAKRATVHVYIATSQQFMDKVFNLKPEEVVEKAVAAATQIRLLADAQPETRFGLQFSPEAFSQTEPAFARTICARVMDAWGVTPARPVILNLPATVEICQPNAYADMIEWFVTNLPNRESAVISVHPHNDRGTAVAATELALLAGADRVEGCLFGNGERTGNLDLVTLALNLVTQGVDAKLDFSTLPDIRAQYERATGMQVPPRQPYAGELVFTAFSGSHQDAIRKGFALQKEGAPFDVPYFHINPAHIGRTESFIRVNSQSGKGGVAYVLEETQGIALPKAMQPAFSRIVQERAEASGAEMSAAAIWTVFQDEYLVPGPLVYDGHASAPVSNSNAQDITLTLTIAGERRAFTSRGAGTLEAASRALGLPVEIVSFQESSLTRGSDAKAIAFVELQIAGSSESCFGVAVDADTGAVGIKAFISGINRLVQQGKLVLPDSLAGMPDARPGAAA